MQHIAPKGARTPWGTLTADLNAPALWAALTAVVWYAFGTVPLQIAVSERLGLTTVEASSWIFIVWFAGAISTIGASLMTRQPIPITWSIPGLVYLGTLAGRFSFAEIAGANLMAGAAIAMLGLLGIGGRILRWLPLPIAMGMFAGSILGEVTRLVAATVGDVIVAGAAVTGYLAGRFIANQRVPPVGLAVVAGGLAVVLTQRVGEVPIVWSALTLQMPAMAFSPSAFIAISLPMIVLTIGLGNVQGLGFLLAQGYRPPVNQITTLVGVTSIINALFGGHSAIVARTGVAILAGPDAGPVQGRYWASVVAAVMTCAIALAASPIASLLGVLPPAYIIALAGIAILSSFQEALAKAFGGNLKFGAVVAFTVAATPFGFAGITSAFWALLVGLIGSLAAEREELLALWLERSSPTV